MAKEKVPDRSDMVVYCIRLPVDRLEAVKAQAATEGVNPSTMLREWVLERLEKEEA
jgi:predicted DNA binding CopG/RHH family protein